MNAQRHCDKRVATGRIETNADYHAADYMAQIGERVKSIRARRGMTRKLLSTHSGISERYLSQVESGQANISVALLWRIAQAVHVEVHELLPDSPSRSMRPSPLLSLINNLTPAQHDQACSLLEQHLLPATRRRGIALIGLRGAGKSELGNRLGRHAGVPFVDLVQIVEKLSGMEVGELFALGGQKAYRRLEQQALDYVLERYPQVIVEAGGSLVTQAETYHKLLSHYHTVWLKAKPDEHMQRVIAQGDMRPMQGSAGAAMQDLKRMLVEREKEYQAAHYTLDTAGRSVQSCFDELISQVSSYLN